jgi:hypothetical protein
MAKSLIPIQYKDQITNYLLLFIKFSDPNSKDDGMVMRMNHLSTLTLLLSPLVLYIELTLRIQPSDIISYKPLSQTPNYFILLLTRLSSYSSCPHADPNFEILCAFGQK